MKEQRVGFINEAGAPGQFAGKVRRWLNGVRLHQRRKWSARSWRGGEERLGGGPVKRPDPLGLKCDTITSPRRLVTTFITSNSYRV
jgi:hypothetical protein